MSAGYALGNLFGPMAGGILADYFGYPWGAAIIGTVTTGYLAIYILLPKVWPDSPRTVTPSEPTVEMKTIESNL